MHARLFYLIIALLFLLVTGYYYKNNSFTFSFVDEEYNFAIGKYLVKNEVLYDDIITNHQPITHILSSIVQKYSNPNNIFLLVVRHREFVIAYSLIWSLLLIWIFGLGALIFIIIYELSKSYLFGNLFLAESFSVYPLLLLIGFVTSKSKFANLETFFLGLCTAFSAFLLGPIWPVLGFLTILLLVKQKKYLFLLGVILVLLPVLKYSSISGYLHYYLYDNLIYTIPNYHNELWILTILKSFITPVFSFTRLDSTPSLWIIRIMSLLLVINILFSRQKNKFLEGLLIFTLLGLTNIRFFYPGSEHYNGFHLLPWYATLIFISSLTLIKNKIGGSTILKIINTFLITSVIFLSIKYAQPALFTKRDVPKDYIINYSTHSDRGELIKKLANSSDTLFVSPDAWMVYWQSNINHLPKQFGYYAWMAGIPTIHSALLDTFTKKPPTFLYCDNCKGLDLERFLNQYTQLQENGNNTSLYVLNSKLLIQH